MTIHELDANESPEATEVHGQRIMQRGSERFDSKHRRKDGSTVDVEVSVTFVPEQRCLVLFLNDITKRKAAEGDRLVVTQTPHSSLHGSVAARFQA
jgi:PAS domain S-box-containing protein